MIESGHPVAALAPIALIFSLWLTVVVWRLALGYKSDFYIGHHPVAQAESRLRRTWFSLVIAAIYVPVAPLSWMVRA
ncbi:hypothetical protein EV140_2269 [Microcella alkaliphila]|uniref:Uncharacterized protein n=1 Tax=Microcella alkaliphila TaxID=279828 RepID=A0A4Q7TDQ4_9MICO|nr:hypothetical protein EV140_2269 [Microcella alkaliphila]